MDVGDAPAQESCEMIDGDAISILFFLLENYSAKNYIFLLI